MRENDCIILEQVHTCLNYEELIGSKISSFGPCFLSRIDSIEFARKYLNSRFRSETSFQSCLKKSEVKSSGFSSKKNSTFKNIFTPLCRHYQVN